MTELDGCDCFICLKDCPCINASGNIFTGYNYKNNLLNIENSNKDINIAKLKPIIECNSKCKCKSNCNNRLVGKYLSNSSIIVLIIIVRNIKQIQKDLV